MLLIKLLKYFFTWWEILILGFVSDFEDHFHIVGSSGDIKKVIIPKNGHLAVNYKTDRVVK